MLPRAAAATPPRSTAPGRVSAAPDLGHGERRPFVLPPLPYAETALAPVISARTVHFHYHRHHAGYLANLNRLLANHPLASESLVTIIRESAGTSTRSGLFNNAAQVWNHGFYWLGLTPRGGGRPGGALGAAIERDFGGFDPFRARLIESAIGQFGSGWTWLCAEGERLTIRRTGNAETPIQQPGITPLLTIDVWEHAYYLDYQNRRSDHVTQVVDRLLNWSFAAANLESHRRREIRPAPVAQPSPAPLPSPQPVAAPSPAPTASLVAARTADSRAASFSRLARSR